MKCHKYWPEELNRPRLYGQVKVTIQESLTLAAYTVRTFSLQMEGNKMERIIRQFHFTIWPDHGVPNNCAVMLNFIRRVRKMHPYSNPCPLLVHCSAGVGRTGTFIVLDTMLERMKEEDTLNVYDYVKLIRQQRVLMVQTLVRPLKI